ncbi:WS/DGAT domain-containing protein [Ruminiclostridium papyrosolvens]|uniref:O-acyltransferase WSD1 C-terminal domain-containing protein n=1 Tax=Ruminiclostridium papyrosolvens C7 TaxID=1330534 RepID=U4R519_9FIRM|nr:WS/DGAT domain-containing protein [Ruminiclostridium papyrosolvens]EPR13643.1 hypothetical protein L323_03405 [Ruminiclostridium papyrosolvens C7]
MKYKAETFDYLQYLYHTTGFNDHQVHCVIKFETKVNSLIMKKAAGILINTVPILARVYKQNEVCPYWEDSDTLKEYFYVVESYKDFEAFTFSKTNEELGPQIKFCLLRAESDSLSIVVNHMVTDGAGIKHCVYLLSEIYSRLLIESDYKPEYVIDGDRGFKDVISGLSLIDKIKILIFNKKDNNQSIQYKFPMSINENISPFILTHEVSTERYTQIRNFCNLNMVTVNDVMLTAYFRVLSKIIKIDGELFGVPIMIDMRRHLKDKSLNTLTNLSSTAIINACVYQDESFLQTLEKISNEMKNKKNNYLGLNTFLKLDTLFGFCKGKLPYKILKNLLKNPNICMTNIGIIDSEKLVFLGSPISNAYICGSIKYRPHFQMAISSFNNKMTLSVNLYGSQEDRDAISEFFALIDDELLNFT